MPLRSRNEVNREKRRRISKGLTENSIRELSYEASSRWKLREKRYSSSLEFLSPWLSPIAYWIAQVPEIRLFPSKEKRKSRFDSVLLFASSSGKNVSSLFIASNTIGSGVSVSALRWKPESSKLFDAIFCKRLVFLKFTQLFLAWRRSRKYFLRIYLYILFYPCIQNG